MGSPWDQQYQLDESTLPGRCRACGSHYQGKHDCRAIVRTHLRVFASHVGESSNSRVLTEEEISKVEAVLRRRHGYAVG